MSGSVFPRPLRKILPKVYLIVTLSMLSVVILKVVSNLDFLPKWRTSAKEKQLLDLNGIKTSHDQLPSRTLDRESQLETDALHQRAIADLVAKCANITVVDDRNHGNGGLPMCPCVPPNLEGEQPLPHPKLSMNDVIELHPEVRSGSWRPVTCRARQRLCVMVTYRNRSEQVAPFLAYIHERLQRQQREYSIYVIEQSEGSPFNRGLLFNTGFLHAEANQSKDCDCLILHDIDMFAQDDRNLYMCPEGGALHMAAYRQHLNYSMPYVGYFGGITAVSAALFRAANGYSNLYFGWGSEDDELLHRLFAVGAKLMRHLPEVSRITMVDHPVAEENKNRLKVYFTWKSRWRTDGLNNAQALVDYTHVMDMPLVTWIYVNINEGNVKRRSNMKIAL